MTESTSSVELLIGGKWVPARAGTTVTTYVSGTEDPIASVAAADVDDVDDAVAAAVQAQAAWGSTSPGQRREILERAAQLLLERSDTIATSIAREMGATFGFCQMNIYASVGYLKEAAAQTYEMVGEVVPSDVPGLTSLAVRQPAGVTVGIAPWNAPLVLGVRAVAMPLAYGNTVILKASEQTPVTQAEIARVLHDAGVPAGAIGLITNAPDKAPQIVERLVSHPDVRRINFTGSTRVGRIIAELAGKHLKRVLLELGGKAPLLVLKDASIDDAVAATAFGAFMNQGQICMSTERVLVAKEVVDEFSQKLAAAVSAMTVGDPLDPRTQIGPMVHAKAADHVESLIQNAVDLGAEVLAGGERDGLFVKPTVLRGVTPKMRIYHEESFGPVASIIEVSTEDEAIEIANDTPYGLASALFTNDLSKALELSKRISAGVCHVNGPTLQDDPLMPFGGVKDSGYGRFGARASLDEFTELRWITLQAGSRSYPG
ncbi:aldehyde dehydrogenase [Rhodococcus sp. T2V]|uniref:aldehyde dehydrogenase n=1 Tax=Rhodococcus sp. T2V TaxID=3034164 RepID=UPI0023E1B2CF|nr:aldehyde dehydrogenase [Rhodococcus sp. T2V]MDF3311086.1 aldehyde dehydrogenase [Rhodococcus sp. T2V]